MRSAGAQGGRPPDAGSATVWVAALAMLGCTVFAAVLAVGAIVAARHRAESAADLAALAAADRLLVDQDGGCGRADGIAAAQAATMVSCSVDLGADTVEVVVEVPTPAFSLPIGPARARARAGPVWAEAAPADTLDAALTGAVTPGRCAETPPRSADPSLSDSPTRGSPPLVGGPSLMGSSSPVVLRVAQACARAPPAEAGPVG